MKIRIGFIRTMLSLIVVCVANSHAGDAHSVPVISVTRFNQEVDHVYENCRDWSFHNQHQLRIELERELTVHGLRVVERQSIRDIHSNEHGLPNLDATTQSKKAKFIAARFTITGGITELGICEESTGSGFQLGGIVSLLGGPEADLKVATRKAVSKVKLVAQVVSVETGEILRAFTARGEIEDSGVGLRAGASGIGGEHRVSKLPPIERASNQAIQVLAAEISEYVKSYR